MKRLEMYEKAKQLAYEQIDMCSALNDAKHKELNKLPEEQAIKQLTRQFLQEAFDYNFGDL